MNSSDIDDPYLWLEELASAEVRAWIAERNAATLGALADARFEADRSSVLDLLNADDRIPQIGRRGSFVYNFWKDAAHPKGIWRRTTLAEYRNKEPAWDVLLDVDALARAEGEDWVWQGCDALPPDYRRGLVRLSRGGADANVTREFDLETRRFLDDGFKLPEAKTSAAWMDEDRLLVATPLGGEEFATQSGYARTVRLWRRGTPSPPPLPKPLLPLGPPPPDAAIAPELSDVERSRVTAGGVTAANRPQLRKKVRRSCSALDSPARVGRVAFIVALLGGSHPEG